MTKGDLEKFKLPDAPGVYLFRDGRRRILYIGKAASLRDRVRSYFSHDLGESRGARIVGMREAARFLTWIETDSVLEALILEANLIKKHQPPYNVEEKDNKSFNYLVITKEDFPRVLVVRGRELFDLKEKEYQLQHVFGPFPQGGSLKEALKIVRRIFPFRDTCIPGSSNPCFNKQLGLCPGVCSGEIGKRDYAKILRRIVQLFSGKMKALKQGLERDMKRAAKEERFEGAAALRRQVSALEHIRDVALIKSERRVSSGSPARVEAYDVAHTAGKETVAVMTVVEGGEAAKASYRKFIIRSAKNNDVAALREALERRLAHQEWPLPKVFVVDGGKQQVSAAEGVLRDVGLRIPVVGVVKNEFHKPQRLIGDRRAIELYERDILLGNSEAHRFAITWHRRRMRRAM